MGNMAVVVEDQVQDPRGAGSSQSGNDAPSDLEGPRRALPDMGSGFLGRHQSSHAWSGANCDIPRSWPKTSAPNQEYVPDTPTTTSSASGVDFCLVLAVAPVADAPPAHRAVRLRWYIPLPLAPLRNPPTHTAVHPGALVL